MKIVFLLIASIILLASVRAEDDLTAEARQYLKENSTPESDAKWRKWWEGRAADLQREHEYLASEEAAADEYLTAWFRARAERFKRKPPEITRDEKVVICQFYLLYKDRKWRIPERVAEHITKRKYDEVFGGGR